MDVPPPSNRFFAGVHHVVTSVSLIAALVALAVLSGPTVAQADDAKPVLCSALPISVNAERREDVDAACLGAGRAVAFLNERGYQVHHPLVISVADTINPIEGAVALGYFHAPSGVIKVLARSALSLDVHKDTVLGLPTDRDLYASVFAHEVAHAIFHQNLNAAEPSLAAHEYFAYTVQIATLPEPLRDRVLSRFPGAGFSNLGQVSEIFLGLDPQRFAVNAYLHFRGAADQEAVLRRLATLPSALEMY